ncbi:Transcription initiation factor TFIID subunit 12 [Irineochytrium annulatum]|nr:Transcription initiation factor TFIID subunit 12 [Irineochytrium annulatum]
MGRGQPVNGNSNGAVNVAALQQQQLLVNSIKNQIRTCQEQLKRPDLTDIERMDYQHKILSANIKLLPFNLREKVQRGDCTAEQAHVAGKRQLELLNGQAWQMCQMILAEFQKDTGNITRHSGIYNATIVSARQYQAIRNNSNVNTPTPAANAVANANNHAAPAPAPPPVTPAPVATAAPQIKPDASYATSPFQCARLFTDQSGAPVGTFPLRPKGPLKRTHEDQLREIREAYEADLRGPSSVPVKGSLQDFVGQVDLREKIDRDVEEMILEMADDFIESVTNFGCKMAKHRRSSVLEVKDLHFHLERNWNLRIPGFNSSEVRILRKGPTQTHITKSQNVRKASQESARASVVKQSRPASDGRGHGESFPPIATRGLERAGRAPPNGWHDKAVAVARNGGDNKRTCDLSSARAKEKSYDINLVTNHMPIYEPLLDEFLADYFSDARTRKHLLKLGLIDDQGRIVDKQTFKHNQINIGKMQYERNVLKRQEERALDRDIEVAVRRRMAEDRGAPRSNKTARFNRYPITMWKTALNYAEHPSPMMHAEQMLMGRLRSQNARGLKVGTGTHK